MDVIEDKKKQFAGLSIVVVGGGSGLGRQYCIDLGRQGASVLVAGRSGSINDVADEITIQGGIAKTCQADARDGDLIIRAALKAYGKIDGLIVNAGITRDSSFGKLSQGNWDEVLSVHIEGAAACARAVWEPMRAQRSGHILFSTSGAGMHGNFGQANYATAKAALIGLTRGLALEGAARNIMVNAIAPMAHTAMTKDVFDAAQRAALRPEDVSPVALALVHPGFKETGTVVETGGGWVGKMRWQRSRGLRFDAISVDQVIARWAEISRFDEHSDYPQSTADSLAAAMDGSRGV